MKTRKAYIKDVVKLYKKNHPEEYKDYLNLIKYRRKQLTDKTLATFKDKKGRVSISMPEQLWQALDYTIDNPRFLKEPEELRWIAKTFPQFMIPHEY